MDHLVIAERILLANKANPADITESLVDGLAHAILALVEEQRRTNELLSTALGLAIHVIRYGDTMGMGDALDSFTVHPRDPSLEVG